MHIPAAKRLRDCPNYCLTTLLQPLLCYLAYKEMYF